MPKCNTENHMDAALAAINAIKGLGLTPVEQVMVLTTASQVMENQVEAAATAMGLKNIVEGRN